MPAPVTIDPDDFLETAEGRVWTPERNAEAWALAHAALETAIARASTPVRVVLICGVQGAGKSTWIASQSASPSIVYFDAALPGARHRATVIDIAQRHGAAIEAVWIDTPPAVAIARNAARPPDKRVPVAAILSVAGHFEEPTTAEGFDRVQIQTGRR